LINYTKKIDILFFKEPPIYSLDYIVPLFLYILSKLGNTEKFEERIGKILNQYKLPITRYIPVNQGNLLYLLWAVLNISYIFKDPEWEEYFCKRKQELNLTTLIQDELRDKDIYLKDGLISIFLLLSQLKDHIPEDIPQVKKYILRRIENSEELEDLIFHSPLSKLMDLMEGGLGPVLFYNFYKNTL